MVEFALIFPVFLLLVTAIIAFGHFFFVYILTVSSAREAVRYGSVMGVNENGVPHFRDCDGIYAAAKRVGLFAGVDDPHISVSYDDGPQTSAVGNCLPGHYGPNVELGNRILVDINIVYRPIVPFLPMPDIPISAHSTRTILRNVTIGNNDPLPPLPPYVQPTSTPTATGTSTETATPTDLPDATSTPGPTNTPFPTFTPTDTPTVTPTPTATFTHTPTATVTFTPTPVVCPVAGILAFQFKELALRLENPGADTVRIEKITLLWPGNNRLKAVSLGQSDLWSTASVGMNPPSGSICSSGCTERWNPFTPSAARDLYPHEPDILMFEMSRPLDGGVYTVSIEFNNGCPPLVKSGNFSD